MEHVGWQLRSVVDQRLRERRPQSRSAELPATFRIAHELEDLLYLNDGAVYAGDLADARDATAAVSRALQLHDDLDSRRDRRRDARLAHGEARHSHHLFQTGDSIARTVGMDGGHGPLMAGGHRLEHVEGLFAADLADDDAVGT